MNIMWCVYVTIIWCLDKLSTPQSNEGHFMASHYTVLYGKVVLLGEVVVYVPPYISELTLGTNRSLVSFTSLVISSDNVNRGLVLFLLLCLIYNPGHN